MSFLNNGSSYGIYQHMRIKVRIEIHEELLRESSHVDETVPHRFTGRTAALTGYSLGSGSGGVAHVHVSRKTMIAVPSLARIV